MNTNSNQIELNLSAAFLVASKLVVKAPCIRWMHVSVLISSGIPNWFNELYKHYFKRAAAKTAARFVLKPEKFSRKKLIAKEN